MRGFSDPPAGDRPVTAAGGRAASLTRHLGRPGLLAGFALLLAATVGAGPVAGAVPVLGVSAGGAVRIDRSPTIWTGGVDLYRSSAFSTQPNLNSCVPASVQGMLNLISGTSNHDPAQIAAFYAWGRAHNAYSYSSGGLDPASWAALLTANGGGTYRDLSFATYTDAIRAATTALRETNKPVGLLVDHGHHAWVMTGFTATSDPLRSPYVLTGVTVMGPLYPRPPSRGYDPPPGAHLTTAQLAGYLTSYTEAFTVRWTGDYVIVAPTD